MENLLENERYLVEDKPIFGSSIESSTKNKSHDGYISENALEDVWYIIHVHQNITTRDSRLRIGDQIRKTKSEWKGAELL